MKDDLLCKNVALGVVFQVYNRRIPAFWTGTLESVCSQIAIAGFHIGPIWKDADSRVLIKGISAPANYAIGGAALGSIKMRSAQQTPQQAVGPPSFGGLASPFTSLDHCVRRAVLMSAMVNSDFDQLDQHWRAIRDDCKGGDIFGMTILHWACALGCGDAFRWGIENGLGVAGVSNLCWGCADLAKHNGYPELAAEAHAAGSSKPGVALAQACQRARAGRS